MAYILVKSCLSLSESEQLTGARLFEANSIKALEKKLYTDFVANLLLSQSLDGYSQKIVDPLQARLFAKIPQNNLLTDLQFAVSKDEMEGLVYGCNLRYIHKGIGPFKISYLDHLAKNYEFEELTAEQAMAFEQMFGSETGEFYWPTTYALLDDKLVNVVINPAAEWSI